MHDFSFYLTGILLSYSAFLLAVASPGPNMLAIMGTSMSVGRKSGIALALGVACGSFTWSLLTVFGLSAILATYASALNIIKLVGGAYLLWLAFKSFRAAASVHDLEAQELAGGQRTTVGYFQRGYAIMMTNPKAIMGWIAIASLGMQEGAPIWVGAAIVIGIVIMSFAIHLLYAVTFSTPVMVRFYSRARRVIQGTLGAFFTFAGLRLLSDRS